MWPPRNPLAAWEVGLASWLCSRRWARLLDGAALRMSEVEHPPKKSAVAAAEATSVTRLSSGAKTNGDAAVAARGRRSGRTSPLKESRRRLTWPSSSSAAADTSTFERLEKRRSRTPGASGNIWRPPKRRRRPPTRRAGEGPPRPPGVPAAGARERRRPRCDRGEPRCRPCRRCRDPRRQRPRRRGSWCNRRPS